MTTHHRRKGITPGPWHVLRYNDLQYAISNDPNHYVEKRISDAEDHANAAAIEAVPDMMAALRMVMLAYEQWDARKEGGEDNLHYAVNHIARDAMAKAGMRLAGRK